MSENKCKRTDLVDIASSLLEAEVADQTHQLEDDLEIVDELKRTIADLESEVEALRAYRDGYDIKDKQPLLGQPIRILTAGGKTWFDYIYHPKFESGKVGDVQRIVRWWPLPEASHAD